jgi:putative transcriptional regulator
MIRLRVKEVAAEKGISQTRLSRWADVDPKIVRQTFHEPTRSITLETLNRLANALGVDARELIEYTPDEGPIRRK